ncbi:MAG TPA: hypothetical protein VF472_24140 [Burkholderiaceae bacterium]
MKTATINLITKMLSTIADLSPRLLPLLQVLAVIIALGVIGLMIWKGKP